MSSTIQANNRELLETIPEVITLNPYRQLGLDVSATPTVIRRACEDMLAALQINRLARREDYLAFLSPPSISKEAIERARRMLQDPAQRAINSFFWPTFEYAYADRVRALLRQGSLDESIALLQSVTAETVGQDYQNAIHDYGLLVFIAAQLHPEAEAACQLYTQAVGILIASSRTFITNKRDQEAAIEILITAIAQRTQLALDHHEYADACEFFSLLDELPFDEKAHEDIATRPFRQLFGQLTQHCSGIREKLRAITDSSPRSIVDQLTQQFNEHVLMPVQAIAENCHYILEDLQLACDNLVDCGRGIAVLLHNQYDDSQAAYRLFQLLVELPASEAKSRSIQNDFAIITRHARLEDANQLMGAGRWDDALKAFQDARALCTDNEERAHIDDDIQRCQQAATFLSAKRQPPNLETIWNGFIGTQIRRCLRNALWVNLLLTAGSLTGGMAVVSSMREGGVENSSISILVLLILLVIWAVNNLWVILRQYRQLENHPIARQLTQYGPLEWVIQSIDNEYSKAQLLGNTYSLTQLWFMRSSFFGLLITRSADIIWAYKASTRHSTNGIPTHTTHGVLLRFRDKRSITIDCGSSEDDANEMLRRLNQLYPWFILGYSAELESKWSRYPEQMMREADERRKYLMPFIDTAYPFVLAQHHASILAPFGPRMALIDVIQQRVIPIVAKVGGAICIICFFWALFSGSPASSDSEVSDGAPTYSPSYSVPDTTSGYESSESSSLQAEVDADDAMLNSWQLKLDAQKNALESLRNQIASYKASIQSIESANERGEYVDQNRYDRLLNEHNRLVREYNSTRNAHNALVDKYNNLVNERNGKLSRLKQLRGGY